MKEKILNKIKNLNATDLVVISFYIILSTVNFIFSSRIEYWALMNLINTVIIISVFLIAHYDSKYNSKLLRQVHNWYIVPLIFLTFKELYYMIKPMHGRDYDELLIMADRLIFGTDPTRFLYQFANPVLTEFLQIVYSSFYFLPIFLGIGLLMKKRYIAFDYSVFSVVYGFFLSYLGYMLLPAIGPRFTLHNFETTSIEMPGLFLTEFLREVINSGESIPSGTLNPAEVVQRDVFPSGHTQMTLIVMYLSWRLKLKTRWIFIITGSLLIFSTVYLRYHYFIDLPGGALFMILTMWSGLYLYNKWAEVKGHKQFSYKED